MKKLANLVGFVFALAVVAVAFAQSDRANVPPRDGCTFENGRTTCVVNTVLFDLVSGEDEEVRLDATATLGRYCEADADGVFNDYLVLAGVFRYTVVLTTTTVFRGNSPVVASESSRTVYAYEVLRVDEEFCYSLD